MTNRSNYIRVGPFGASYRMTRGRGQRANAADITPVPQVAAEDGVSMVDLAGATVLELAEANPTDIVRELESAARRIPFAPWVGLAFVTLAVAAPRIGLPMLLVGIPLTLWLMQWDKVRRAVVTFYDVEGQPAASFENLVEAHTSLKMTHKTWNIEAAGALWTTHQRKRNAGASALNTRSDASHSTTGPTVIVTNILVPTLNSRRRSVYFFPERILIREGKRFAAVSYESLDVAVTNSRFIEEDGVPRDSQQVGTTWRFVNKDGSRDKRFKDNRQLPIMLYGRLTLSNPDGFLMIWDFSQPKLAFDFADTVRAMARNASTAGASAHRSQATAPTDGKERTMAMPQGLRPFDLWGQRGWHGQEVAGESHYSESLLRIIGGTPSWEWTEVVVPALLVPQPSNPHDSNAVAVVIQDSIVGHLPRRDAANYQPVLVSLLARGFVPRVSAQVRGGLKEDGSQGTIFIASVRLDLGEPHLLIPANLPPETPHVMLPSGRVIQVTGEEAYIDFLGPMAGATGQAWAYVTLHEVTERTTRTSKSVVEIRLNGSPGGRLTQQMGSQLLPVIRFFAERGVVTAARATLKRGSTKTDITLQVAPTSDLTEPVLASLPVSGVPITPDTTMVPRSP